MKRLTLLATAAILLLGVACGGGGGTAVEAADTTPTTMAMTAERSAAIKDCLRRILNGNEEVMGRADPYGVAAAAGFSSDEIDFLLYNNLEYKRDLRAFVPVAEAKLRSIERSRAYCEA